jgi:hypothetical protein
MHVLPSPEGGTSRCVAPRAKGQRASPLGLRGARRFPAGRLGVTDGGYANVAFAQRDDTR